MSLTKKTIFRIMLVLIVLTGVTVVRGLYVPTKRDTMENPEPIAIDNARPTELDMIYQTDDFEYYFRDSRDTIAIYDKRNGYTWKTGTDLEFNKDIDDECDEIIDLYEEQFYDLPLTTFGDYSASIGTTSSIISVYNGRVSATIQDLDETSLEDDIKFELTNLNLVNGTNYRFTFTAGGNNTKTIKVVIGNEVNEIIEITSTDQTFIIDFVMTGSTITNGTVSFYLGNVEDDFTNIPLHFDDLMLEETDGTDIIVDTNQILRGDFELLESELTYGDDDLLTACRPQESRLNTTYTGFANSLVTIEYYDQSDNIKRLSSASHVNARSTLKTFENEDGHFLLEIGFSKVDIDIDLHIYFDNNGIRYEVLDEDVTGDEVNRLASIIISPFLGASGGAYEVFDVEEVDYTGDEIFKPMIPGYSFIPDGSGTLVRFTDNDVDLLQYEGQVYGKNPAQEQYHYDFSDSYVPFKQPSMPVFGIAHGDNQAAFVAYATKGEEYMQIISIPEENLTYYNYTYPRFEYNKVYLQVYNKMGWGYNTLYDERNHFDINLRYDFLNGDGSDSNPSANYVGMAQRYREYLLSEGMLTLNNPNYSEVPIRLDFLMSDVEKSVAGYQNMVTTNTEGVDKILASIINEGITNINSGLLGWNDGGLTIGDPRDTDFTREIGRKGDFEDLILKYKDLAVDISFEDNYYLINEEMMSLRNNATQHTNSWYAQIDTFNIPVNMFYYARPEKSVKWMLDQTEQFLKLGVSSVSISGISNNLTSDYTNDILREKAKEIIMNGYGELDQDLMVNNYQPNSFLWAYTDRYLSTPVYGTQFLIETDTVPFLQLVLQGTMEMYAPYSNFSFYTDKDVLRMIDYNIYPSFVLTDQPAYLLVDTNSRNYYSTEYDLYDDLIQSIYTNVNGALSSVIGVEWENRIVPENGVIVNTYANGVEIIINYTDETITYNGTQVEAVSYEVVGE